MSTKNGINYQVIYPKLNKREFNDRKNRIYQKKLDWMFDSLKKIGFSERNLKDMIWIDIGCGSGYFLKSLEDKKIKRFAGFDKDRAMINIANQNLNKKNAYLFEGPMEEGLTRFKADIYTSFFVIEHHPASYNFFKALRKMKRGTIFAFSVPVFSLANLFEEIFPENCARCFNGEIHTQIFTQESIDYSMKLAGFKIKAKWLFGQDFTDLYSYLTLSLQSKFPSLLINKAKENFLKAIDEFQSVADKHNLADQQHILAIKK